jgi:hypothetical protein
MRFSSRLRFVSQAVLGLMLVSAPATSLFGQGAAPNSATPQTTLVEPPTPLLPQQINGWVKADQTEQGDATTQTIGTDGQILKEDGLKRYERAVYHSTAHPDTTATVSAYQFVDATGAHSAYSYYSKSTSNSAKIGEETGKGDRPYLFRSGATIVSADLPPASSREFLSGLESRLPKVAGPKALPPLLPTYLPSKGLEADSIKYSLGPAGYQAMGGILPPDIIGFDKAAEVVTAKYAGKGTLTLLLYPTPQIAGDHGRAIEAEMNRQGAAAGTVKLRREGPLVLLTTGSWIPVEAERLIENIHLRSEVTWNKSVPPVFQTEIRKTVSLLTSIAILSGVLMLAAVVLGLFFGGARAAIRVMQGKPAATEPEFLRIDLSGRSAKIHTEQQNLES